MSFLRDLTELYLPGASANLHRVSRTSSSDAFWPGPVLKLTSIQIIVGDFSWTTTFSGATDPLPIVTVWLALMMPASLFDVTVPQPSIATACAAFLKALS